MASSSDEGEIAESGNMKASSLSHTGEKNGVDPKDRPRSKSPDFDSASRYSASSRRSRSPRGNKRPRDDRDHYGGGRDFGSRHSRPHYDDRRRDGYHRSRPSYEDLDRPSSHSSHYSYDPRNRDGERARDRSRDRDRHYDSRSRQQYSDKRPRNRSRSPRRSRNEGVKGRLDRFVRGSNDHAEGLTYEDDRGLELRGSSNSRTTVGGNPRYGKDDAKHTRGPAQESNASSNGPIATSNTDAPNPVEPEEEVEEPEPIDEELEIERRRKRREEILAKSSSATPLLLHAVGASDKAHLTSPATSQAISPLRTQFEPDSPRTPRTLPSESPRSPDTPNELSPGAIDLLNDKKFVDLGANKGADDEEGPSAADYDPTADMKEDERRDELRHGQVVVHGESHMVGTTESKSEAAPHKQAPNPASEDPDDDLDMFAEDFDEEKYTTQPTQTTSAVDSMDIDPNAQANGGILEGDDKDGYYKHRVGEVLGGRYQVQHALGKGMFSGVVRAMDVETKKLVAIKIMRNNDALKKGGFTEIAILEKLNESDPDDRRHVVKFERSFEFRGHLCMVFEHLGYNLREILKKYGLNVGITLKATKAYAYQIFVALAHMRKCNIIHADLKPDNILVNENHTVLKICDLGTAIDRSDAATAQTTITPYLVSRFYRAPEVILGIPYDYGVDVWSIGCTLFELYTGKILFTGDSNNQMLKAIMEVRGRITPKLYKRGQLSPQHFDEKGQFVSIERDKILGKTTARTLQIIKPTRDIRTRLAAVSSGLSEAETRDLNNFIDLLDHCLALNPEKRIQPLDALKHPFFSAAKSSHSHSHSARR
uniref:non-specific serine/threonine protein kinase n=1 Tax=Bionectria ochroleuca TaxID=29856 RepID=A0A8H7TMS3_BIOOC